jgi:LysM domain
MATSLTASLVLASIAQNSVCVLRALLPLKKRGRCGPAAGGGSALLWILLWAPVCWALTAAPLAATGWDDGPAGGDPGWDRRGAVRGSNPLGWLRHSRDSFQQVMRKLARRSAGLPEPPRPGPGRLPILPERLEPDGPWSGERDTERRRLAQPGRDRPGDHLAGDGPGPRVKDWHRSRSPSCRRAGAPVDDAGWYVVAPGDTLWRIARIHYGNGRAWRRILHANWRAISDPNLIYVCQHLFIPRWRTERPPCEGPEDERPRRVCNRPWCDDPVPPQPSCQRRPRRPDRPVPGGCARCGAGSHVGDWGWR